MAQYVADNPHFETARDWRAARGMVAFRPLAPGYTAGFRLQAIRIHVRDHKMRDLAVAARSLEAHYGAFSLSQARKGASEARRLALEVSYGRDGREARIAGHEARVYERGPEPAADDIDGRSPAAAVWHDGEMLYLVASAHWHPKNCCASRHRCTPGDKCAGIPRRRLAGIIE